MTGYEKIINEMYAINSELFGDYIVEIYIRDDHCRTAEVVSISPDNVCWLNDWWEGQEVIELVDFINIDNIEFYGECYKSQEVKNG